ncbi:hypothetical protein BDN72DRAFT_853915 [Pluteus cervinus]|uniref:Uncharacterized protein n=1 Tax=Pluteus cervinus TaxID=181527 RepID=A0ACD3B9S3_9AGAR|nr:hypothetical protein BDN72DRAFT_853915 [Pluteus cervinus]
MGWDRWTGIYHTLSSRASGQPARLGLWTLRARSRQEEWNFDGRTKDTLWFSFLSGHEVLTPMTPGQVLPRRASLGLFSILFPRRDVHMFMSLGAAYDSGEQPSLNFSLKDLVALGNFGFRIGKKVGVKSFPPFPLNVGVGSLIIDAFDNYTSTRLVQTMDAWTDGSWANDRCRDVGSDSTISIAL